MLAVIVIQLVVMVGFVAYGSWWAYRASATLRAEDRDISLQLVGIFICSIAIIIRGCYRTGELSQGFSGTIAVSPSSIPPAAQSTDAVNA